jgi:hypothetical protein
MFVLSLLFYKERTILSDEAYLLFYILKDCSFAIQHYRFGEVVTQVFPVVACKAGLSLKAVMMWYSASFVIFFLASYAVCGLLKQYGLALVMLLTQVLLTTETFYYEVSQLLQGITFILMSMAFVQHALQGRPTAGKWILGIVLITFSAFFHPLVILVLAYLLVFYGLDAEGTMKRKLLIGIGATFVAGVFLKAVIFRSPYESHALGGLKNFIRLFPDYFTLYSHQRFLANCLTKYYWVPVVFFAIVVHYYRSKDWKKLWFFLAAFFGYLFLINISYPNNSTSSFYIENMYVPLALILAVPFVFDVLPSLANSLYPQLFIVVFLLTCCIRFFTAHGTYTERLNWERNILAKYGEKKAIISAAKVNAGILGMLWGTPYEFWLLSTLETGRTASLIIDEEPRKRDWAWNLNKSMLVNWNVFPYSQLPVRYFHFTDTTTGYIVIE